MGKRRPGGDFLLDQSVRVCHTHAVVTELLVHCRLRLHRDKKVMKNIELSSK